MFSLEDIRVYEVNKRGEEKELLPEADRQTEGIRGSLLKDRKGRIEGSLHVIRSDSLFYLYVNIEHQVEKIRYEFPRKKGECLFLTAQLQSYISNKMYFVHVKAKDDNAVINTAGQTYVSLTAPEDAEIVIGDASTSDRLLQLLTKVVNEPGKKDALERIQAISLQGDRGKAV